MAVPLRPSVPVGWERAPLWARPTDTAASVIDALLDQAQLPPGCRVRLLELGPAERDRLNPDGTCEPEEADGLGERADAFVWEGHFVLNLTGLEGDSAFDFGALKTRLEFAFCGKAKSACRLRFSLLSFRGGADERRCCDDGERLWME